MGLMPWEPSGELMREPYEGVLSLRDAMNRLLEDRFIGPSRLGSMGRVFPVDVRETDTDYVIEASLPGIKPEEMQITAAQNTVTIRATRKHQEKNEQAGTYVRRERYEGEVSRRIGLPIPIAPDKVTATYEQGVLTLRIPKAEAAKGKEIKIQVSEPRATH